MRSVTRDAKLNIEKKFIEIFEAKTITTLKKIKPTYLVMSIGPTKKNKQTCSFCPSQI